VSAVPPYLGHGETPEPLKVSGSEAGAHICPCSQRCRGSLLKPGGARKGAMLKELAKSYNVGRAPISRLVITSEEVQRRRQEFDRQNEIAGNIRAATK
jgi:hypothetical protein